MLQKMYTFIIQRGYMGSLIMLTGLAIMSFMDIKRRAVPVYMNNSDEYSGNWHKDSRIYIWI